MPLGASLGVATAFPSIPPASLLQLCTLLLVAVVLALVKVARIIMGRTKRTTVSFVSKSRGSKKSTKSALKSSTQSSSKQTTPTSPKSTSASAESTSKSKSAVDKHLAKRSLRALESNARKARSLDEAADADEFLFLDEEKTAPEKGGLASYFKKVVGSAFSTSALSASSSSPKGSCTCGSRNDALDSLVNNKQFSDVVFLVGHKEPALEETKEDAAASSSSLSSSLSASASSLDEDDAAHTSASSLINANPKTARIYAIRSLVASSSDVFKAMLSGGMYEAQNEAAVIYVPDCSPRGFVTMLRHMYTNRPDLIDVDNLVDTMYCAHKYQVETLLRMCSHYIKEHLSIENVCRFLLDCDVWVSAAFMKFISVHADEILQSPEFLKLERTKVMSILESDALSVNGEFQVFDAVCEWGRRQLKKKRVESTPENLRDEVKDLIPLVRFPQMSLEELLDGVVPTGLLTEKEVFSIIMFWQTLGEHKCDFVNTPRLQRYIDLTYEKDWDENGVIFFIGSKGGTESFSNPHGRPGGVTNKMSSRENGNEMMLTSRTANQLYTNSVVNSSIGFDLGEERLLTPTHYTMRHGFSSANYYPRNWNFEGSVDGSKWDVLRKHTGDSKINTAQGSASWEVDISEIESAAIVSGAEPKYRHFRVRNTGMDHSHSNYLMVCGLEVYGKLYTKERHGSHFNRLKKKGPSGIVALSGALLPRGGFGRR